MPGQTYEAALYDQKVYFHKLGTPQSADRVVYQESSRKNAFCGAEVTHDGRYVVLTSVVRRRN